MKSPLIMGILNVTPDSFSDGGRYEKVSQAADQAAHLVESGASILDVGAESSRPGAKSIDVEEEWARLAPVLEALQPYRSNVMLSVDSQKSEIMRRSIALGIDMINDVGGKASPADLNLYAGQSGLHYLCMHMYGTPQTMQRVPLKSTAVLDEVSTFFNQAQMKAIQAGFSKDRVWLDPGVGFGKTDAANVKILGAVSRWADQYQIAVGVSRKSLMGRVLDIAEPQARDAPSKMLELGLVLMGAKIIRTHEVATLRRLIDLLQGDA